jgi:polyhydroxyalkanoate synthesis repressor PhaR
VTEPRVIKKYPNRRLYDTERSCYITVDDVRKLIVDGVEFQVRDADSDADITRSILIQIITEHESGKSATFSTEMLAQIIRLSNDAAQETFSRYLDQSMRLFLEQQQVMGEQVQKAISGKTVTDLTRRNLEFWQNVQDSFLGAAGVKAPPKKRDPKSSKRRK